MIHPLLTLALTVQVSLGAMTAKLDFHNHGKETAFLFSWKVCNEGSLNHDVLVISRDGQEVDYKGPIVKRAVQDPKNYIKIAPGQHWSCVLKVDSVYDVAKPGLYRLRYEAYQPTPETEKQLWLVKSPDVEVRR